MRTTGRLHTFVRSSKSLALAITLTNVTTYGFTVLAARLLGPREYGAVASLLATLLVVGVLQLGLQATGARRVSHQPDHRAEIEHEVLRVGVAAAVVLGLALLVLSPAVERLLRLDDLTTAVLLALSAVPLTVMGAQSGVLQGERRWLALSVVYLALGVPRLVIGGAMIVWRPDQQAAVLGILLAAVFPVVAGWWALRRSALRGAPRGRPQDRRHPTRAILTETAHNSQALLAFFALSNADVVVARHAFDTHRAGLYAAGLILAKAMMFLPQFVVVVAFPDLATETGRRKALLQSLVLVAALGVVGVLGALLLQPLALAFVGGSAYTAIGGRLWLFALLGTVLSMLQLLVYAVLARSGRRPVVLVWLAFLVVVVGGSFTGSVTQLLTLVLVTDGVLLLALLLTDVRTLPSRAPAPPPA